MNLPTEADTFFSILEDEDLLECFLNHPDSVDSPLDFQLIRQHQQQDVAFQHMQQLFPNDYPNQVLDGVSLVCYVERSGSPWKICLPDTLIRSAIQWHHQFLNHLGQEATFQTINTHYYHPQLRRLVNEHVSVCDTCQRYKLVGPGYGELPSRIADLAPWNAVAVDCIGPWSITLPDGQTLQFNALTCIDPVTNLVEIVRINGPKPS